MKIEFIDSLGLDPGKADAIKTAIRKDSFYRGILFKIGIHPFFIEKIVNVTDTVKMDESQPDIIEEKARLEWRDLIGVSHEGN